MRLRRCIIAIVAILGAVGLSAQPTAAAEPFHQIADGFAGPLQMAVGSDGTLYVSQSFAGTLTTINKKGVRTDLASGVDGGEVAGVDAKGKGTAVFTSSNGTEETEATSATLNRVLPNGRTRILADLFAYEHTVNPDQINTYNFVPPLPADCPWPPEFGPSTYTGILDTHPYAVAIDGGGYYVADAAANAILRVDKNGHISTTAVLPPQPLTVTQDLLDQYGLDGCLLGRNVNAEPVPTDVEIGPGGMLYVTTLSGSDNVGSVYKVNPRTGTSTLIATGFVSATNLAIGSDGTIYVAELFADRVSKVVNGAPVTVVDIPGPAGLEFANGKLYVTYDAFGNGKVGTIAL